MVIKKPQYLLLKLRCIISISTFSDGQDHRNHCIRRKSQPLYPKAVTLNVYKADQSSYDTFAKELLFYLKRNKQEVPIT
jgi:hypothetical protein